MNNLVSNFVTFYKKWEIRSWKWEGRSGKWEMRCWKREIRYDKWEIRNLEVVDGVALNWAPGNGKWDSNEDSRD